MTIVSVIQASPVYEDLPASMDKAAELLHAAAREGAQLVTFGETWLPGYPKWIDYGEPARFDYEPSKRVFARLVRNSVVVGGPETERLARLARDLSLTMVIGIHERVLTGPGNGTLYNSLLTFTPEGGLVNHHRKLVPTYTERLVWGPGDGAGLRSVESPVGRVSALVCWEHWMPLARQALHNAGETFHVAVWPTVSEAHQVASRHYAFEGRCFVLAAGALMTVADYPAELRDSLPDALRDNPDAALMHGGSAIIGPDANLIAGPVFDEETILTAEVDPEATIRERMTLDVTGHYARPDVFVFEVKPSSRGR